MRGGALLRVRESVKLRSARPYIILKHISMQIWTDWVRKFDPRTPLGHGTDKVICRYRFV